MWWRRKEVKPAIHRSGPWDRSASSEFEKVVEVQDIREVRSLIIDEFLSSKTFSAGVYAKGRIKTKTEKTVRRSMNISDEDILKVVIDGTHFGSAKNGFVISVDGFYWKEFWGNPQFTNWEALSIAQSGGRLIFSEANLRIDNALIQMTFGYYSARDLEYIINGILNSFHSMFASQE